MLSAEGLRVAVVVLVLWSTAQLSPVGVQHCIGDLYSWRTVVGGWYEIVA